MKHLLLLLIGLCPLYCARGQSSLFTYPIQGATAGHHQITANAKGWLAVYNDCIDADCFQSDLVLLQTSQDGALLSEKRLHLTATGSFLPSAVACLSDGDILLAGFQAECGIHARNPLVFRLDAEGQIRWQQSLGRDVIPAFNLFKITSLSPLPVIDALWIGAASDDHGARIKLRLSDGAVQQAFETTHYTEITRLLPVSDRHLVWYHESAVEIYKDEYKIRDIPLVNIPGEYGLTNAVVKTYPVAPHIAVADVFGNLILADLEGDTTVLRNVLPQYFDIRDGQELVLFDRDPFEFGPQKASLRFFSRQNGHFKPVRHLPFPDFKPSHQYPLDLHWAGAAVQMTFGDISGVVDFQHDDRVYFKEKSSNHAYYTLTIGPDADEAPIPTSDAALVRIAPGDQTWWYPADESLSVVNAGQLQVVIRNDGETPLNSVTVVGHHERLPDAPCFEDVFFSQHFTDLNLLPGDSVVLLLTDLPAAGFSAETPFCFWLAQPNGQPDAIPANNNACLEQPGRQLPPPGRFRFFPNPVHDRLFITLEKKRVESAHIQLCNLAGQVMFDGLVDQDGGYFILETGLLTPGMYLLRVGDHVGKIVKE